MQMSDKNEEIVQSPEEKLKLEILKLMEQKEQHLRYHKMENIFPDEGIFARELYP